MWLQPYRSVDVNKGHKEVSKAKKTYIFVSNNFSMLHKIMPLNILNHELLTSHGSKGH